MENRGAPLAAGTFFAGRYRIGEVLGTGGTGTVYAATHVESNAPVALKLIHRHLVANEQVSRRFSREADILQRLEGDHLIPLLDFGEDPKTGRLFLALQRIEGDPLDLVLHRGLLPVDEAVRVIQGISVALASAHEQGVIHRDLKPANVLLEHQPLGPPRVRVFDFGLARVLRNVKGASTTLTGQNMIFGTPEYMAPEQVRGEELDPRSDVYAAGAMLYELLTGHVPFLRATGVATMTAHLNEALTLPSLRAPHRNISPALDAVTIHALAKSRHDRYPSMVALRHALAAAVDSGSDFGPDRHLSTTLDVTHLTVSGPESVNPFETTLAVVGDPLRDDGNSDPLRNDGNERSSVPSSRITAAALVHSVPPTPPRPWVWLLVAFAAALLGITIGFLVARCKLATEQGDRRPTFV